MTEAFDFFLKKYPNYSKTEFLDRLREDQYPRLNPRLNRNEIYLDYTGGALYSDYQLYKHHKLLKSAIFGNTHSSNQPSQLSTKLIKKTRSRVLKFFKANPEEYDVIFTLNASGALKLVGESFPFDNGRFLLTMDNHNSVNGIREFATEKGAHVTYVPTDTSELRINSEFLRKELANPSKQGHNLFAYPAQSNFSSVIHSLSWIERAQSMGWNVLLDASAFVPTNQLDLSKVHPCYVAISFYKIFGYPTGIGALIAKKSALKKLGRPWFAGGTIEKVTISTNDYIFARNHTAFEDGTLNYLNIPAIDIGLKYIEYIGYDLIHTRVKILTSWLLETLLHLRYHNGQHLIVLYGPQTYDRRGGAIAVNFCHKDGRLIPHTEVEKRASKAKIAIRAGCMCNPGSIETIFKTNTSKFGIVRISIGAITNFHDVYCFVQFCKNFLN